MIFKQILPRKSKPQIRNFNSREFKDIYSISAELVLYQGFQTISDLGFLISEKTKIPFLSHKKKLILPKSNILYK
jgi:hypothetical protein